MLENVAEELVEGAKTIDMLGGGKGKDEEDD